MDQLFNHSTYLTEKWFAASAMEVDEFKHKHTTIPPIKQEYQWQTYSMTSHCYKSRN
jgi:hypothetical protein